MGVLIFVSWVMIRSQWLIAAVIVVVYAGILLFFVGVVSIIICLYNDRRKNTVGYKKKSMVTLSILLINFPVSIAIISTVLYILGVSTVTIENQSNTKIENMFLSERGHLYTIDSVLPTKTIQKKITFQSEGPVHYSFTRGKTKDEGILLDYVSRGMGNSVVMVVTDQGRVQISEKF
jgi:heme/copper-type cytochrome/quinol oxidase subunit 2